MKLIPYETCGEAYVAAKQCMLFIQEACPGTGKFIQMEHDCCPVSTCRWVATDGVLEWDIWVGMSNGGWSTMVEMCGENQMSCSWLCPLDGSPEDVINNCIYFRKINLEVEMGKLSLLSE